MGLQVNIILDEKRGKNGPKEQQRTPLNHPSAFHSNLLFPPPACPPLHPSSKNFRYYEHSPI